MLSFRRRLTQSTVGRSLRILPRSDRRRIYLVVLFQVLLGFLDLFAVALVGLIGVLASTGIRSTESGNNVQVVLSFLQLENMIFQQQVASLALIVAILLRYYRFYISKH